MEEGLGLIFARSSIIINPNVITNGHCFPGRARGHGPGLRRPHLRDQTWTMTRSLLLEKISCNLSFSLSGVLSLFSIQLKLYTKFTAFIIAE